MNKLLLIELNEINFDLVEKYTRKYPKNLPNFINLKNLTNLNTYSESEYHELEPWIQWVSAHTGKKYKDHKIFRLGDVSKSNQEQIFEKVESYGFNVGSICCMNVKNSLQTPSYFVPDPWTQTETDGSIYSNFIKSILVQTVNDNSISKISIKNIFLIIFVFLKFIKVKDYLTFAKMALSSFRKPWRKALFLDYFIHKIHLKLFEEKKPNFSTIFFNSGAHIQHRYFFNSEFSNKSNPSWYLNKKYDPFFEMLLVYEKIIGDYLDIDNTEVIFATGLSQKEFVNPVFYWRLKNHADFLKSLDLSFLNVFPRMTRDFLIEFRNEKDVNKCYETLSKIQDENGEKLFGDIDKQNNSLFVTLTYPKDIVGKTFSNIKEDVTLENEITFVAIKNGEHASNGKVFTTLENLHFQENKIDITELFNIVDSFFKKLIN
tara:strand:- start:1878 stop:3170 length:1293 start_codon:yes stop_codon:yes gene_type:complete